MSDIPTTLSEEGVKDNALIKIAKKLAGDNPRATVVAKLTQMKESLATVAKAPVNVAGKGRK